MNGVPSSIFKTIGFVLLLSLMQACFDQLEFDRQKILLGEVWRAWTGHFVHANSTHFFLNVTSGVIVYFLFFVNVKLMKLFFLTCVFAPIISLVLLIFYPNVTWYCGLSGLLHAIASFLCLTLWKPEHNYFGLGLIILWSKVLLELIASWLGYEGEIGGVRVLTDAHLIGVFFGTLIGGVLIFRRKLLIQQ